MDRVRDVLQPALHGGTACGVTSEARPCNTQACDKDCVLADWTAWGSCSKPCDLGHRERMQNVLEPPVGAGHCPSLNERKQNKGCNPQKCPVVPIKCRVKSDIVLVIDGSGSVGTSGWAASISAAKKIVTSMDLAGSDSRAALSFTVGPRLIANTTNASAIITPGGTDGIVDARGQLLTAVLTKSLPSLRAPRVSRLRSRMQCSLNVELTRSMPFMQHGPSSPGHGTMRSAASLS